MKRGKLILICALAVVLVAIIIGLTQWYKPHRKVEGEQGIVINSDSLITVYNANEHAADSLYLNKTIQVRGLVAKVDRNEDGQTTVLFNSADPMSTVFCTMRDKGAVVDSGKVAVLKGICSGHTSDVLLTDCIIVR
jgi:hypothetical protein